MEIYYYPNLINKNGKKEKVKDNDSIKFKIINISLYFKRTAIIDKLFPNHFNVLEYCSKINLFIRQVTNFMST